MGVSRQSLRNAAYAGPAVALSALGFPLMIYLPPFYATELGLGVAAVGFVFMLTRLWDLAIDPVLGIVIDRFPSRFGRRRHWLVISTPVILLAVWALFNPPNGVGPLYLFGWMVAVYTGWTLFTVAHLAWGAELESAYHGRSRIMGWREFALGLGMFLLLIVPAAMEMLGGADERQKMAFMGGFILLVLPLTTLAALLRVGEPPSPRERPRGLFDRALLTLVLSPPFMRVSAAQLLVGFGVGVTTSLYVFFITRVVQRPELTSVLLLVYFLIAFLGIPPWLRLSYRLGKHRTLTVGMLYWSVVLLLPLFSGPGAAWLFVLYVVLFALADGASQFLFRAIIADISDQDLAHSGQQRTGMFFALATMAGKAGQAVAVGVTYPALQLAGFDPASSGGAGLDGLKLIYVAFSAPAFLIAAALMWNFPLGESEQRRLRSEIEAAEGGRAS
jgi:GPH family glycoside/pentoside/hexuronide:cation symporter